MQAVVAFNAQDFQIFGLFIPKVSVAQVMNP